MASSKLSQRPVAGLFIRGFFWELPMLLALLSPPCRTQTTQARKRLLVLRLDAIGDFLLFLDALQKLRRIYPPEDWEITLLGNRLWEDLAVVLGVADQYRFIDLVSFEINPLYRLKTLSWVRSSGFDLVLQGVYSRSFYRDDAFVRVSHAPKRIGYAGDAQNSPASWLARGSRYYTDLVVLPNARSMHTLQTHATLIGALGGVDRLSLPVLPALGLPPGGPVSPRCHPYFVLVPGASLRLKQWPSERFAAVAQFIHRQTGWQPVLLGGVGDRQLAREVAISVPTIPWLDLTGKTSLVDALAIIGNARFYLGNDTGLTHMATIARIPTLVIVGGAFRGRDFPYPEGLAPHLATVSNQPSCSGCGLRCTQQVDNRAMCIHDIRLEAVLSSLSWL